MQKYLVSYTVCHNDGCECRRHYISHTQDLPNILRHILGDDAPVESCLKQYEAWGQVQLPANRQVIKRISIDGLRAEDEKILAKYFNRYSAL